MSATETPLVTTDELNKIMAAENERLRLDNADRKAREQVGKEAFDKMRAELDGTRRELAELVGVSALADKWSTEVAKLERDFAARDALIGEMREALLRWQTLRNESQGVAGYHLNGNVAEWSEFDDGTDALLARTPADAGEELERLRLSEISMRALGQPASLREAACKPQGGLSIIHQYDAKACCDAIAERDALRAQLATAEVELVSWRKCNSVLDGYPGATDEPCHVILAKLIARAEAAEARVLGMERDRRELAEQRDDCVRREQVERTSRKEVEARLDAVLGALDLALNHQVANRGKPGAFYICYTYSGTEMPEWVSAAEQALDAARTGDAVESAPKTNTSEQCVNAVATSGDAAHPDSVKLAEILRLHTVAEAANDRHREACEAADGEGWANDPTGSMHLTELGRRANERWAEFVAALESAKAGAGVDVAALLADKARPQFYSFADDEMSTESPEEWLDNACYSDGVHVVAADAFRRLPKRYFVWAVNCDATKREDRQKILIETTDKAEAERVAIAARNGGADA